MGKDDATWLKIAYGVFAIIVFYTSLQAGETVGIQTNWADRYSEWFPAASAVVSLGIAAFSIWYLNHQAERRDYFLASIGELRRVTWPGFPDTRRMTIVVCVVVGVFAIILTVFDFIWSEALKWLLA